ncbi:MAG: sigma 54-interacting transcriptional regulator [Planctomycetota bacterium]
MSTRVLFVEDEAPFRRFAGAYLSERGFEVAQAGTGRAALAAFERARPRVVLLDLNLPDLPGMDVLERLRGADPALKIVVLTSFGDAATAVRALKAGATDYLTKPIELERLVEVVHEAASAPSPIGAPEAAEANEPRARIARPARPTIPDELLWGEDPRWLRVLDRLEKVVASEQRLLLVRGESGTGKSALARTFHAVGTRSGGPFIEVHCPSVPAELFELELFGQEGGAPGQVERAAGGTLFLDEVGELPLKVQPLVAHLLETRRFRRMGGEHELEVDLRIVCTAGVDLPQRVAQGALRRDLLARLESFVIDLPPLRERGEDVLRLAQRFAQRFASAAGQEGVELTEDARTALREASFPGNVRELRHMVQRAVLFGEPGQPLDARALGLKGASERGSAALLPPVNLEEVLNALEAVYLDQASRRTSSQREAARLLGLDRFALARRRSRIEREGGVEEARGVIEAAPEWARRLLSRRPAELPADGIDLPELRRELERLVIDRALESTEGNRARAATLVGMSRTSLGRRLDE